MVDCATAWRLIRARLHPRAVFHRVRHVTSGHHHTARHAMRHWTRLRHAAHVVRQVSCRFVPAHLALVAAAGGGLALAVSPPTFHRSRVTVPVPGMQPGTEAVPGKEAFSAATVQNIGAQAAAPNGPDPAPAIPTNLVFPPWTPPTDAQVPLDPPGKPVPAPEPDSALLLGAAVGLALGMRSLRRRSRARPIRPEA